MIRVFAITPYFHPPDVGGVPVHTHYIYTGLAKDKNFKVCLITTGKQSETKNIGKLKVVRLKYLFKFSNTPINPFWFFEIKKIINTFKPDIIMLHTPVPFISDVAALAAGKTPFTVKYHHGGSMKKGKFFTDLLLEIYERIFLRFLLMRSVKVISASNFVANTFLKDFRHKTVTITAGVDTNVFKPKLTETKNRIFFLGSLNKAERYKGLEYLIRAMPLIQKSIKNATLTVVSPGDFEYFYKNLCKELGVSDRVGFLGRVVGEEKVKEIQKSSVVVLPSRVDSCPNILLEAMACAKPVVGSNTTGIPELISDGKNGYLVNPTDHKAIAEKVIRILKNPKLAQRMGRNGLERARKEFTWKLKVRQTKELIMELINS